MNDQVKFSQTEPLSTNEERMHLLVRAYLCHVLKDPTLDFQDKHFLALMDQLFEKGKIEAIKYLRGMFPMKEKQRIHTGYSSERFYKFINEDFSHIKPDQYYCSDLSLKDAKDIVDWIEATRGYTQY